MAHRRNAEAVYYRQIAMYLVKVLTRHSLPEIGRRFDGRDHTTVLHAVRKIEALRKSDESLDATITSLKAQLLEQAEGSPCQK